MPNDSSATRTRERVVVLNDPHAMRINKELAQEIGFQESIVFLQIEFLVSISEHWRDGKRWTRQSLTQLHENYFPWWSRTTLSRIIHRLEERKLIIVEEFNNNAHDHTQWFAIDAEGVADLASVAILQNETSKSPERNVEVSKMKRLYIEEKTTDKDYKETLTDVSAKKRPVSLAPPKKTVGKLSEEEAEHLFNELCENDPNGNGLRALAQLLADENKTGKVSVTRVWREIGERYVRTKERETLSDEAWAYGLDEALSRGAPNIGYVLKAAKNHGTKSHYSKPGPKRNVVVAPTEAAYTKEAFGGW